MIIQCPDCGMPYDTRKCSDLMQHQAYHECWTTLRAQYKIPKERGSLSGLVEEDYVTLKDETSGLNDGALTYLVKKYCVLKYGLYKLGHIDFGDAKFMSAARYCTELLEVNREAFGERAFTLGTAWCKEALCE